MIISQQLDHRPLGAPLAGSSLCVASFNHSCQFSALGGAVFGDKASKFGGSSSIFLEKDDGCPTQVFFWPIGGVPNSSGEHLQFPGQMM